MAEKTKSIEDVGWWANDFRRRFRYEIAALGIVVCGVFAYVGYLEPGFGKLFFIGICILTAFIFLSTLRRERALLRDHAVARGTVLYFRRGEGSFGKGNPSFVTYSFEGPDGETYESKSEVMAARRLREDAPVLVLYKPGDPKHSQASTGFLFYRFRRLFKKL